MKTTTGISPIIRGEAAAVDRENSREQPSVNISSALAALELQGGGDPRAPADLTCTLITVKSSPSSGTPAAGHFHHMRRLEAISALGRLPSLHTDLHNRTAGGCLRSTLRRGSSTFFLRAGTENSPIF